MNGKTLLGTALACVLGLASAGATEAPPVPPGYANEQQVMAAIALRQIKLIDAKDMILPPSVEERLDVEYGVGGQQPLKLDLYLPKGRTTASDAILFIHGGAWKSGKRSDMKYYCVKFAEKGYVTATVTYRLTKEAPFPACVQDVKCAVRWLRANAATYQVNPERIAVSGNSAGGHLAMMIGYSDDPSLEGDGGHPGVSSRVCAVVDFYGPTDLAAEYVRKHATIEEFLGGKTFEEAPEVFKLASPLSHLSPNDPPTLIFQGTIDSLVPVAQSDALASRLKELGIDHVYERYEGWPHVMDLAEAVNRRCIYQMEEFFSRHVSVERGSPDNK